MHFLTLLSSLTFRSIFSLFYQFSRFTFPSVSRFVPTFPLLHFFYFLSSDLTDFTILDNFPAASQTTSSSSPATASLKCYAKNWFKVSTKTTQLTAQWIRDPIDFYQAPRLPSCSQTITTKIDKIWTLYLCICVLFSCISSSMLCVGVDNDCLMQNVHWWRDSDRARERDSDSVGDVRQKNTLRQFLFLFLFSFSGEFVLTTHIELAILRCCYLYRLANLRTSRTPIDLSTEFVFYFALTQTHTFTHPHSTHNSFDLWQPSTPSSIRITKSSQRHTAWTIEPSVFISVLAKERNTQRHTNEHAPYVTGLFQYKSHELQNLKILQATQHKQ